MRRDRLAVSTLIPFLFLTLATLYTAPSWAQEYGEGVLNAIAYRPLPAGQPLRVVPIDNSDQNMALKQEFERQLARGGHTISEDATLILTFETHDEIGAYKSRDRRAFLEMHARGGREGGEDAKVLLNLFDSNTGGVFNQGKGETSIVTQSQYRMDVIIDDKSSGKRLWHAWTIADLGQSDGRTLTKAMVPILVKNVGSTVKRQTFPLY